jgi:hypothetical protein
VRRHTRFAPPAPSGAGLPRSSGRRLNPFADRFVREQRAPPAPQSASNTRTAWCGAIPTRHPIVAVSTLVELVWPSAGRWPKLPYRPGKPSSAMLDDTSLTQLGTTSADTSGLTWMGFRWSATSTILVRVTHTPRLSFPS